ncbi:transposase [Streptomyces lavendulae]|uniref:transposase n=1 Tax=Streptomyces lavendulae TaxID=1914 RepID=UPI0036A613B3
MSHFRSELYACLTARGDVLFGLCDALPCTDGPVRTLDDLALAPEHRCGHRTLYGGLSQGRIDVARLCRALAGLPPGLRLCGLPILLGGTSNHFRMDAAPVVWRRRPRAATHAAPLEPCPGSVLRTRRRGRTEATPGVWTL